MEFIVKNYAHEVYKELIIKDKSTTMESGLLDEAERRELAQELQIAIDDLLTGLEVPA